MAEQLSEREEAVAETAARLLQQMSEQRAFAVPTTDTDPREVHRLLRENLRAKLDTAEELMAGIRRTRRRANRIAAKLRAEADDEFDKKMAELAKAAMRLEYQSVHDRLAMARVHASPQRRAAREAERIADLVAEAEEVMNGMFFGLRDIRRELLATLEKFLPFEASLER